MKKFKKILAIAMATVFVLVMCVIYANASSSFDDTIGDFHVTGEIFWLTSSSVKAKTTNKIAATNTPSTCAVELFVLFPDNSYLFMSGNSGTGEVSTSKSFYNYLYTMRYPFADHHYGQNGVYYGVRSTELTV